MSVPERVDQILPPRHLPNVTLSADISTVTSSRSQGVNDDSQRPMSPACTDTYLCDCKVHIILRSADGAPASFGRSQYVVPRVPFRQVAARDGGCRFPGCNRPVRFTDAHQIQSWLDRGDTEYGISCSCADAIITTCTNNACI